jgi:methylated-DNA-[protein]-cysteine S-methyltransferase
MPHDQPSLYLETVASPIGDLLLATIDEAVCLLEFGEGRAALQRYLPRYFPGHRQLRRRGPAQVRDALKRYFAGEPAAVDGLAVAARGTPFQMRVWQQLRRIPPGRTASYSDIAQAIGRPSAVRAVGLANGRNPVSIIVPCHRIIGRDGSLTGYGGGLAIKAWLLRHEGVPVAEATGGRDSRAA